MNSSNKTSKRTQQIKCACSNCENDLNYCTTHLSCYKYYDEVNCRNSSYCYGCFNTHFQALQVFALLHPH